MLGSWGGETPRGAMASYFCLLREQARAQHPLPRKWHAVRPSRFRSCHSDLMPGTRWTDLNAPAALASLILRMLVARQGSASGAGLGPRIVWKEPFDDWDPAAASGRRSVFLTCAGETPSQRDPPGPLPA